MNPSPSCAFCAIVRGDADAHIVWRTDQTVAFLDARPLFPGHVLLVPARHVRTLIELPDELLAPLFGDARRLAGAVQRAMDAQGTFVAMNNIVSQSVPHLHVHIVPRRKRDGLRGFFWPRHPYRDDAHMSDVAGAIRGTLDAMDTED